MHFIKAYLSVKKHRNENVHFVTLQLCFISLYIFFYHKFNVFKNIPLTFIVHKCIFNTIIHTSFSQENCTNMMLNTSFF